MNLCGRKTFKGLAPVIVRAADLASPGEARAVVYAIARAMGWEADALPKGDGWSTIGIVDGIRVAAVRAADPLGALPAEEGRPPDATAAHAALLTALGRWSPREGGTPAAGDGAARSRSRPGRVPGGHP